MSNFVGIVTPQDTQTGVTLRARVTSPKGHYTAYQDFKTMVKKSGLTDEQAVITDLNTISSRLLANGVTSITSNLTAYMPTAGENETDVKYVVTGEEIADYFNSDGIVTKRPPYGASIVVGSLTITVTKNASVAERNITISIEPYTGQELVQSVLNGITWDSIRGNNAAESSDPETNGMYNVIHPLKLSKTITSELVSDPVSVTWSVEQDVLSPVIGDDIRINVEDGVVTRPAYTDIFEQIDVNIASSMLDVITSKVENPYGRTYYRIGGLTLKATINIDDINEEVENSVTFNLKTLSSALSNKEVSEYLKENVSMFSIKDTKYNSVFTLSTINDVTERTIFFDTTGTNSSVLDMFNATGILAFTSANDLTKTGIKVTNVKWQTVDPDTVDSNPLAIHVADYSAAGFQSTSGKSVTLVLNPSTIPTRDKLVLECTVSINGYDGSISYITMYYRFSLDDLTPTVTDDVNPEGSDEGTEEIPTV